MITQIIPNILHFDSGRFVNGKQIGRGYYFKGEFVSRYKKEMIEIIRMRFNGRFPSEMKDKMPDEYAVIDYFYQEAKKTTMKTEEKKQEYYQELRIQKEVGDIAREIAKLEFKIAKLEKNKVYLDELKKTYQTTIKSLKETLAKSKVQQ